MTEEYLYQELTKKIINSCFKTYNQLGYGCPERVYQKSFEIELQNANIRYQRELYAKILYGGKIAGRFYLDFLIENKVALELKVRRNMYESDWIQLLNYLKATKLQLGILAVFTRDKVKIKRVIN